MLSGHLVGLRCRLRPIRYWFLVDGHAFARNGSLVDARSTNHHEPVRCKALIGFHNDNITDHEVLDRYFAQFSIAAPHRGCARRQLGQCLDRALRSEGRRLGKEGVSTVRSRWVPESEKKK